MHCPVCPSTESKVIDSRLTNDGLSIRRRRECMACQYRFSTSEEMELLDIVVVKNNGKRETYNQEKLQRGIRQSLVKRPFTQDTFDRLIHAIERDIQKTKKREITSHDLGEIIMKHLKKFDKVAYVRFASVYRAFEDVETFQKTLRTLERKKRSKE